MNFYKLKFDNVFVFEPHVYEDERGFFFESFNQNVFNKIVNKKIKFVQINHSKSVKNVIRGIHFQKKPYEQGKLLRVLKGKILDVMLDLRKDSLTYLQWDSIEVSEENKKQIWIPEGYGHGFSVLSEIAEVEYLTTNFYDSKSEETILWSDDKLNIDWNVINPIISEKDRKGKTIDFI